MTDSAKVEITGRLGRDPEVRFTNGGSFNVSFSVAVGRKWTDRAGVEQKRTTWFKVTAWKALAEQANRLVQAGELTKGTQVRVVGSLELREWQTPEEQSRTSADVNAWEIALIDPIGEVVPIGAVADAMSPPNLEPAPF